VSTDPLDLGGALRALRRRADLSQRQLAARAGVPQATVARIESGRANNPSFRTVERLVRAAGEVLSLGGAPPIPHEGLRDAAGRHYPAHLDIQEVTRPERWWGAWWTLTMIRSRWPLEQVPPYTYDRARPARDRRREGIARGELVRVRRAVAPGLGDAGWLWVAEVEDAGETVRVAEARAHREPAGGVTLDGVVVAPKWRGIGLGRRLVEAVRSAAAGVPVTALGRDLAGAGFLRACGFRPAGSGASRWIG
jgi:transcriptional regulator with XRE-family HTH domain